MKNLDNCCCGILITLLLFGCDNTAPAPGEQVFISDGMERTDVIDGYWIYLPRKFDPDKKWPVLLFLQGSTGVNHRKEAVKEYGPVKYIMNANSALYDQLDQFIIINPHMTIGPPEKRQWFSYANTLEGILDFVTTSYHGDPGKTYITGLSKGASGCWGVAKRLPERFAAMVAIAGRINCKSRCEQLKEVPSWIVHNTGDDQVTYEYAQETVKYMEEHMDVDFLEIEKVALSNRQLSSDFIFSSLPQEGHDAWSQTYANPVVYNWMLSKTKQ